MPAPASGRYGKPPYELVLATRSCHGGYGKPPYGSAFPVRADSCYSWIAVRNRESRESTRMGNSRGRFPYLRLASIRANSCYSWIAVCNRESRESTRKGNSRGRFPYRPRPPAGMGSRLTNLCWRPMCDALSEVRRTLATRPCHGGYGKPPYELQPRITRIHAKGEQ